MRQDIDPLVPDAALPPAGADEDPSSNGLTPIIDNVLALCETGEAEVGAMASAFGRAGLLPLVLLPALIAVSPISIIPLIPTICGILITLASLQLAVGRRSLWLPGWLRRRSLPVARVEDGMQRLRPVAVWVDHRTRQRLTWLTVPPLSWSVALACAACGLAMPFLELVPMSATLLGATVMLMALGLLVRDGLLILLAPLPLTPAVVIITKILVLT
ncbi:MAG: exopolysaccharide biosynthesis protein [Pseudomonadota bacterium]